MIAEHWILKKIITNIYYGKEYRDNSDYEKEVMVKSCCSIEKEHNSVSERVPGYYREDSDFETDYIRAINDDREKFENQRAGKITNDYEATFSLAVSRMRSLIIESPINVVDIFRRTNAKKIKVGVASIV